MSVRNRKDGRVECIYWINGKQIREPFGRGRDRLTWGKGRGKHGMEEERIRELEEQLSEEETKINGLLLAG
ncbi:MAG: hypothetical protein KKD56_10460 [Acidobacteria bacterium]|nr:hypothetical protein [Acidobacteriota bacterium]MBU1569435.1 hypothetical protein [Pseudomonadota bacterium]